MERELHYEERAMLSIFVVHGRSSSVVLLLSTELSCNFVASSPLGLIPSTSLTISNNMLITYQNKYFLYCYIQQIMCLWVRSHGRRQLNLTCLVESSIAVIAVGSCKNKNIYINPQELQYNRSHAVNKWDIIQELFIP